MLRSHVGLRQCFVTLVPRTAGTTGRAESQRAELPYSKASTKRILNKLLQSSTELPLGQQVAVWLVRVRQLAPFPP